jgi:hypothetical protein
LVGGEELEQRFRLDGDFEQMTRVFDTVSSPALPCLLSPNAQTTDGFADPGKGPGCAPDTSRRWLRPPRRGIWVVVEGDVKTLISIFFPTRQEEDDPQSPLKPCTLFCATTSTRFDSLESHGGGLRKKADPSRSPLLTLIGADATGHHQPPRPAAEEDDPQSPLKPCTLFCATTSTRFDSLEEALVVGADKSLYVALHYDPDSAPRRTKPTSRRNGAT